MTSVRTNLGPLTTPFTYPASCTVVIKGCATCDNGFQAQTCSDNAFNTQGIQDDLECWPPRSGSSISSGVAVDGWGFYSPGIDCPVGYSTACAATAGVAGGFPFQFPLLPSETAAGCCPTGYNCRYEPGIDRAQTCYAIITKGSFPTVQCSSGTSNMFSFLSIPATITTTNSEAVEVTVLSRVSVLAPLFQLNWQKTDLPSSTTPTNNAATTVPTPSSTPTHPPQETNPPAAGLSKGAAAGIGVGVGIAGLVLIVALVWFVRRRVRKRPSVMAPMSPVEPMPQPPVGHGYVFGYGHHAGGKDGVSSSASPSPVGNVAELGTGYVAELPVPSGNIGSRI